jgi:monoterpene epsilon-lactone hydrolase
MRSIEPVKSTLIGMLTALVVMSCPAQETATAPVQPPFGSDGTVHIPAAAIPLSSYMSEEAKQAFIRQHTPASNPSIDWDHMSDDQRRAYVDDESRARVERAEELYPVNITERRLANVRTEFVEPKQGAPARNRDRILINLHGGSYGFASGGLGRLLEAIPEAGYGKFTVVSVDYRLLPKYKFPAAVEDVVAVYRELLKTYKPQNIGIYGCSTGAALTAVSISWFQKLGLPRPGAIGLFCEGAIKDDQIEGDSYYMAIALNSGRVPAIGETFPPGPYMLGTDDHDPLVAPMSSLGVLSKFPPTLLISGTRDIGLSGVLYTHSRLVKAGAEADLHVWDGMWHAFFFDPDLPESKEAYDVIAKFFAKHLGSR